MNQLPAFSPEQLAADLLVSIVGTLGALLVAYLIYQSSRADQRRQFEAELAYRDRNREQEEEARLHRERQQRREANAHALLSLMSEVGHNGFALREMSVGHIHPFNLPYDALERIMPILGMNEVKPDLWEPFLDALLAVQDFNATTQDEKIAKVDVVHGKLGEALDAVEPIMDAPGFLPEVLNPQALRAKPEGLQ